MTNHKIQLYNLVQNDVFKMMITKLFYLDLSGKTFCQKILRTRVEAEAIQKLQLPHALSKHTLVWNGIWKVFVWNGRFLP